MKFILYTLGCNLSDHLPLCFLLKVDCVARPSTSFVSSAPPSKSSHTLWSKVTTTDIEKYQHLVYQSLPELSPEFYTCVQTNCTCNISALEEFAHQFITLLLDCASSCFPSRSSSSRILVGWKDKCGKLKEDANFWYKVWVQAGRPSSGALFNIKRNAKRNYKSSVRRLQRRQQYLLRNKLARSFAEKRNDNFWSKVKQLTTTHASVVDGISGPSNIANVFATNVRSLLNTHSPSVRDSLQHSIQSSLSTTQLQDIVVTEDDVVQAIHLLKEGKSDSQNLFSEHLKYACPVIAVYLACFFTACFRHASLSLFQKVVKMHPTVKIIVQLLWLLL